MQTIRLNNGIEMPLLGYGLFRVPPQEAERCTSDGYPQFVINPRDITKLAKRI